MTNYSDRLNYLIPGGAHTYSRGDDQYPSNAPQILAKGKGCYVWDPEGNKYLDYGMALRANTLGYAQDEIDEAAYEGAKNGNNLTRASLIELKAAEALIDLIPGSDMVKFGKNGSTVTSAAIKLARAYTGRKYIVRCAEHPFFSYDDWFIGDTPMTGGIPEEVSTLTLNFNFNNLESLQELFDKYPNQIAGIILQPAESVHPKNNFLQKAMDLCHKNGAIFILDEMITGFRWHIAGAQTYYDIVPDLTTFGKAMANGYSVSALVGKREIMELGGIKKKGKERVFLVSTTHGAEMNGLAALTETIKFYKKHDVIKHLWDYGQRLIDGMNEIAKELNIDDHFKMVGIPCSPNYTTFDSNGDSSLALRTLFSQEMIKNKVLIPWVALSYSHGEEELKITLDATIKALEIYKKALAEGVDKYLVGDVVKPVFRKFN
jgi:glutamate-1-semialdehyde 2,1-aminomutase